MRLIWMAALAATAYAAGIRGTVVENQSGHPIAQSTVELEPIAGRRAARYCCVPIGWVYSISALCPRDLTFSKQAAAERHASFVPQRMQRIRSSDPAHGKVTRRASDSE